MSITRTSTRRVAARLAAVVVALVPLAFDVGTARAQAAARLSPAMVTFLSGRWRCSGAFANGRPIASTVAFTPSLGGHWLELRHADVPPNRYQATGMIGTASGSNRVVAGLFDNFGGMRMFASPDGWSGGTLRLESAALPLARGDTTRPPRHERFTYTRIAADTLRIRYEVRRDPAGWVVGDTLTCHR